MRRLSRHGFPMNPLARSFYERNTVCVAKELLGKVLVRRLAGTVLEGMIVETEAYGGEDDPASHAYKGPTRRNRVMYGPPGHAYVYFTYGMHYCLNVKTESIGRPGAVLIRAAQPMKGTEMMKRRRGIESVADLTNGPAKLTQAFAVTTALNGHDLTVGRGLFIIENTKTEPFHAASTSRIGITVGLEKPWRFFIKRNRFVSRQ